MTAPRLELRNDEPAWIVMDGDAEQAAFRDKTTATLFTLLVDAGRLAEAVQMKEDYGI